MPVVTRYGNGVRNPTTTIALAADAAFAEGQMRQISSHIDVGATDSINSVYLLGRVPSNGIIDPSSTLFNSAITGLTSLSVGFGQAGAVVNGKGGALINAQTVAAAGSVSLVQGVAAGSLVAPAWKLAGFTSDPGGMLDIIATVGAAPSAAGTLEAFIKYGKK